MGGEIEKVENVAIVSLSGGCRKLNRPGIGRPEKNTDEWFRSVPVSSTAGVGTELNEVQVV
jgi:hypothetical protein